MDEIVEIETVVEVAPADIDEDADEMFDLPYDEVYGWGGMLEPSVSVLVDQFVED